MSPNKKIVPPPMKRSTLLKAKIRALLSKLPSRHSLKQATASVLSAVMLIGTISFISYKAPEIHGLFLRAKVGSKVYMVKGRIDGGGGTGFSLEAPSGITYIVTNSHVCNHVKGESEDGQSALIIDNEGNAMSRRIIAISDKTDLCLIEGLPGVSGLSLGNEPHIGDMATVLGHPHLRPLSLSRGEIVGMEDVTIFDHVMPTGDETLDMMLHADPAECNMPKNKIVDDKLEFSAFGQVMASIPIKICLVITKDAYMSTIVIFPGNSGSPVVDSLGRVIGVAFASDGTNWGEIVSQKDLKDFVSRY